MDTHKYRVIETLLWNPTTNEIEKNRNVKKKAKNSKLNDVKLKIKFIVDLQLPKIIRVETKMSNAELFLIASLAHKHVKRRTANRID